MPRKTARVGPLGIVAFLVLSIGCGPAKELRADYERFNAVQIGWTQEEVRRHLGDPFKVYLREAAPLDYYLDGYEFKRRPITSAVWIYVGREPPAYVYFGSDDKVEEVVVVGS